MVIKLYKVRQNMAYDITQMVSTIEWGGSVDSAARTADIAVINAPYDPSLKSLPTVAVGDFVGLEQGMNEIFYGRVKGAEKTSENGTVTWNCIDPLNHLLKSTARYNFKKTTAEAVAAQVCADFQFPVGVLAQTGIVIPSMICQDQTIYDIIMAAYTKAYKSNGKLYQCLMENRVMTVVEKGIMLGGGYMISEDTNITTSNFSESSDPVINKVKIYDENGTQVGEVVDSDSDDLYGTFQTSYDVEKGVDQNAGARALLAGPEQTLSIEAIGDMNATSGRGVQLRDSATGRIGLYWITTDKHSFHDGIHTMSLDLEFKNMMAEVEAETEEEKNTEVE